MHWHHATGTLPLDRPRILGVVNVTPDSFSDGGRLASVDDARRLIDRMLAEGADAIDVGGESTRPQGATAVSVDDELQRVLPVIEAAVRDHPDVLLSIDTVKSQVAQCALDAGASIVNDVSAFRLDPAMAKLCAVRRAGVVLMHSRGDVADMATFAHASYADLVNEVMSELALQVEGARDAGIAHEQIVIDPGIGFSKRGEHSLRMLHELGTFGSLGFPILVGVSRKRFIGEITGVKLPADRVAGSIGANVAALSRGAMLFRVHDVKPHRDALDVAWAIARVGEGVHAR
jgi:dihydropteroate synthase